MRGVYFLIADDDDDDNTESGSKRDYPAKSFYDETEYSDEPDEGEVPLLAN